MPDGVVVVFFLTAVVFVCFVVHVICQNHKFHKEQVRTTERISRIFDHLVVRRARQSKTCTEWVEAIHMNSMARGAFEAIERIYEGSNPPLSEILNLELDVIHDSLLRQEDNLRSSSAKEDKLIMHSSCSSDENENFND